MSRGATGGASRPWTPADDQVLRGAIRDTAGPAATFPFSDLNSLPWERLADNRPALAGRTKAALVHRAKILGIYKPAHSRRHSPRVVGATSQPGTSYRPAEDDLLRRLIAVEWPGEPPMVGSPTGFWDRAASRFMAGGYARNSGGLRARAVTLGLFRPGGWVGQARAIPVGATAPLPLDARPAKAAPSALRAHAEDDRTTRWVEIDGRVVQFRLGRIAGVRGTDAYTRVDHADGSVVLVPIAVERFVAEWERLLLDQAQGNTTARGAWRRESGGVS